MNWISMLLSKPNLPPCIKVAGMTYVEDVLSAIDKDEEAMQRELNRIRTLGKLIDIISFKW